MVIFFLHAQEKQKQKLENLLHFYTILKHMQVEIYLFFEIQKFLHNF